MLPTIRSCVNRTSREIRNCRRHISKTSTAPNSDAITRQQKVELDQNSPPNKWIRLNKHNNNRALSTIQTKAKPQAAGYTLVTKDESREFMATFPDIVRDLTDAGKQTDIPEVTKHFAKVLHYNVPNGKKTRGLAVVAAYKMLEKPENLTPENIMKANIMGWCVELLNAALYVIDDILDHSENRRGVPCWYRTEDVGLRATYDAALLEEGAYSLLKANFSNHHCYIPTLEMFQDIALTANMGQTLDSLINKGGKPNFELFTMSKYNTLIKYKTAYYTLQWPTTLAMYLANLYDVELHRQANAVLWEMGVLFQVQNDFLDCFGDPDVTGKKGNDISEGKCTWLAVVALQRANPAQRKIMEEYYGKPDATETIRNLYKELGLPKTFAVYEEKNLSYINMHIQQMSKGLPHKLFLNLLEGLYRKN